MNDITHFEQLIGSQNILVSDQDKAQYLEDWRGNFTGKARAILQPRSVAHISQLLAYADAHNVTIVTQGGNTGLVGGGIPDHTGQAFILSTAKLNAVREFSVENKSIVVEAGCVLSHIHDQVEEKGLYFPLNLGAKGSCTIGGNLATNAGGLNVVKYGTTRELCLGIEAVLIGGRVMNLLTPLRKDNTGYDLKNLFIGSEGTLGIITAASLKLFALPQVRATALVGIPNIEAGVNLLGELQRKSGEKVEAFEIMPASLLEIVCAQFEHINAPLSPLPEFMILMEIASTNEEDGVPSEDGHIPLNGLLERFLAEQFEKGSITDAVMANSETQRKQLWEIRENAPEATKKESWPVNTDISVTRSDFARFYHDATKEVHAICPDARICGYGHLGDGNVHFNVLERAGGDPDWAQKREAVKNAIYAALSKVGGSISAEHGVGQLKAEQLKDVKDPVALDVMRGIKCSLDPKNLLNPGKILV